MQKPETIKCLPLSAPGERERFWEEAQVQSAREVFGIRYDNREEFQAKPEHVGFIRWVEDLGRAAGLEVTVAFTRFTTGRRTNIAADCTADSEAPTVRFNRAALTRSSSCRPTTGRSSWSW